MHRSQSELPRNAETTDISSNEAAEYEASMLDATLARQRSRAFARKARTKSREDRDLLRQQLDRSKSTLLGKWDEPDADVEAAWASFRRAAHGIAGRRRR